MTTAHHAILLIFWMILGSCVGSFLNVCLYRVPRGMSVLRPRSRCPRCGAAIRARDNLPVLGWLLLRGCCRECRSPISPRYPAIELATGLLFASPYVIAVGLWHGDPWERIGAWRLIPLLLACWTVTGLAVFAALLGWEARGPLSAHRARDPHPAAAGCGGPAANLPRSPADSR